MQARHGSKAVHNGLSRSKPTRRRAAADGVNLAAACADAGYDKKASRIEVVDVRGKVDYADYVVVMSGSNNRQVQAIAQSIKGAMERRSASCLALEGMAQGTWVLIDFGDVIVHVFHQDLRDYYDLEALWMDAERVPLQHAAAC